MSFIFFHISNFLFYYSYNLKNIKSCNNDSDFDHTQLLSFVKNKVNKYNEGRNEVNYMYRKIFSCTFEKSHSKIIFNFRVGVLLFNCFICIY